MSNFMSGFGGAPGGVNPAEGATSDGTPPPSGLSNILQV